MNKERVALLRKRVSKDPYDAASWESLVSEADRARRGSERNAELTAVYEDLLSKFPTAVRARRRRRLLPPAACCSSVVVRTCHTPLCSSAYQHHPATLPLCRLGTGGSMPTTR